MTRDPQVTAGRQRAMRYARVTYTAKPTPESWGVFLEAETGLQRSPGHVTDLLLDLQPRSWVTP